MKDITWSYKNFNDLTNKELYEIFRLRLAVFVVEQNCPYQDADGKDLKAMHVLGYPSPTPPAGRAGLPLRERAHTPELIAYARILPPNISYQEVSIGRVVTSQKARKTGAGKMLMEKSMEIIKNEFGSVPIRIGAQAYLENFYSDFGFKRVSENYLEDNIPHLEMLFVPR